MPRYFVNRSFGWPVMIDNSQAKYALGEEFESEHTPDIADAIMKGHLVEIEEIETATHPIEEAPEPVDTPEPEPEHSEHE